MCAEQVAACPTSFRPGRRIGSLNCGRCRTATSHMRQRPRHTHLRRSRVKTQRCRLSSCRLHTARALRMQRCQQATDWNTILFAQWRRDQLHLSILLQPVSPSCMLTRMCSHRLLTGQCGCRCQSRGQSSPAMLARCTLIMPIPAWQLFGSSGDRTGAEDQGGSKEAGVQTFCCWPARQSLNRSSRSLAVWRSLLIWRCRSPCGSPPGTCGVRCRHRIGISAAAGASGQCRGVVRQHRGARAASKARQLSSSGRAGENGRQELRSQGGPGCRHGAAEAAAAGLGRPTGDRICPQRCAAHAGCVEFLYDSDYYQGHFLIFVISMLYAVLLMASGMHAGEPLAWTRDSSKGPPGAAACLAFRYAAAAAGGGGRQATMPRPPPGMRLIDPDELTLGRAHRRGRLREGGVLHTLLLLCRECEA